MMRNTGRLGALLFVAATLPAFLPSDASAGEQAWQAQDLQTRQWMVVNDGVMGGRSQSAVVKEGRHVVFSGNLSLENNGGFASVRTPVAKSSLANTSCVKLRVRGDGRTYEFRARMHDGFDGVAFKHPFETRKGEWQMVELEWPAFRSSWRGMRVPGAGPVRPADIRQVGFLLADKQPGAFRLEVASIGFCAVSGAEPTQTK